MNRSSLSAVAICLLSIPVGSSSADPFLPLDQGNTWIYDGDGGAHEQLTVTGTIELFGQIATEITYSNSTDNEGLRNFWSADENGDVALFGFERPGEFGLVYDPPIPMVDAPLSLGKQWSHTFDIYEFPSMQYLQTVDIHFEVYEEGDVVVPFGTFYSYGIGQFMPASSPFQGVSLTGEVTADTEGAFVTDWWSGNLGRPKYWSGQLYELTDFNPPTPVETSTWGRVKATFAIDRP
ncbi:MAG: hypothetical protein KC729_19605 [Candidatus Eisenbacteria bacterium]|uniref:PEP-CTERM sorting domain-containing protein n=1 Tax=Eiseniibacteriota bacterium TaxID=2212470 RepID=A0A956RSP5_UNCEI|nr:hypothetical protein [Candidatus Eisenbacteria bacterium]